MDGTLTGLQEDLSELRTMDNLGNTENSMLIMYSESINCMDMEECEVFDPGIQYTLKN